jgi:hypothetical protein
MAREVWLKILNPCDTDGFFAVDLHVWLLSNLSSIVIRRKVGAGQSCLVLLCGSFRST